MMKGTCKNMKMFSGKDMTELYKEHEKTPLRTEVTISDYLSSHFKGTICSVAGLRYTGKVALVLKELKHNGLLENTVWIECTNTVMSSDVRNYYFAHAFKGIKALVIFRANKIEDLHEAQWLVDLSKSGVNVILIMPGDLFFKSYSGSKLKGYIHSVYTTAVTYSDYREMNRKDNVSFAEYVYMGNIDNSEPMYREKSVLKMHRYDTGDSSDDMMDIVNAIVPNKTAKLWFGFVSPSNKSETDLFKSHVVSLMIDTIRDIKGDMRTGCTGTISFLRFASQYTPLSKYHLNSKDTVYDIIEDSMLLKFGIKRTYNPSPSFRMKIIYALCEMKYMASSKNCVVKARSSNQNMYDKCVSVKKYYFTNPAIVNRLAYMAYMLADENYYISSDLENISWFGLVYESAILYNMSVAVYDLFECNQNCPVQVTYYRDTESREVDLVVTNKKTKEAILAEIKHSSFPEFLISGNRIRWVQNKDVLKYFTDCGYKVIDRYIIMGSGKDEIRNIDIDFDNTLFHAKFVTMEYFMKVVNSSTIDKYPENVGQVIYKEDIETHDETETSESKSESIEELKSADKDNSNIIELGDLKLKTTV